jgi:hypothetical protein
MTMLLAEYEGKREQQAQERQEYAASRMDALIDKVAQAVWRMDINTTIGLSEMWQELKRDNPEYADRYRMLAVAAIQVIKTHKI